MDPSDDQSTSAARKRAQNEAQQEFRTSFSSANEDRDPSDYINTSTMGPRRTSHRRNHDNASGPSSSESIQITSLPRGPVAMTPLDYRSAMDRVRAIDEADGQLEPWLRDYLHQAVWTIWHYLCICPDYIMTKAEFGIFTYFRGLYPQEFPFFATSSPIVELAIERYWRNTYANPQVLFDED